MDSITHAVLSYLLFGGFFDWRLGGFVAILGALPDIDILLFPISERYPKLRHRSIIHSILFMAILPPPLAFLTTFTVFFIFSISSSILFLLHFLTLYVLGTLAYAFHLLIDSLTYFGAPSLWPFRKKRVKYDIFGTVSISQAVVSLIIVGSLNISRIFSSGFLFPIFFFISAILYASLFSYFIISKIRNSRSKKTSPKNNDYYR